MMMFVILAVLELWFWAACALAALTDRAREEAFEEWKKEKEGGYIGHD